MPRANYALQRQSGFLFLRERVKKSLITTLKQPQALDLCLWLRENINLSLVFGYLKSGQAFLWVLLSHLGILQRDMQHSSQAKRTAMDGNLSFTW